MSRLDRAEIYEAWQRAESDILAIVSILDNNLTQDNHSLFRSIAEEIYEFLFDPALQEDE